MMRATPWSKLAVVLSLVACYGPERRDCAVSCGEGGLCPEGMQCSAAGLCVREGAPAGSCSDLPAGDASTGPDTGSAAAALHVQVTGKGEVALDTGQVCDASCTFTGFTAGAVVTLTATPDHAPPHELDSWGGLCSGAAATCAATLAAGVNEVSALFARK